MFKVNEHNGAWSLARESEHIKFPGLEIDYALYKELHHTREFDKHFQRKNGKLVKRKDLAP